MEQILQEFFHNFRQDLRTGAEDNSVFQLEEFMKVVSKELIETDHIEGFEFCSYRAQRGMGVDGYYFNDDENTLDLFIADFNGRDELASLTQTDVIAAFKRVVIFFETSLKKNLYADLEETSPEYDLAWEIADRGAQIRKINFFLFSERALSERFQSLDEVAEVAGIPATRHIWDISRIQRQQSSRGHKEPLDLNFEEMFGRGIPCLSVHLGSSLYQSYLIVIPGAFLATLYKTYGARLLEHNVRSFLQCRGKVNQGIRKTILKEPQMFFAYNNGITATAEEVETRYEKDGLEISRIKDLQIVNGGQTTASLFHTQRKDKVSLQNVFVQMKLSIIDKDKSEDVVSRISEYANTQNLVNAADFFSNHPFHIRMEEFSRRIWTPAQQGAQRETKWFYERTRGQYVDAQSRLTPAEQRRFKAEYPKQQMFTKTDLAKFENVWDDHPKWVNLSAQKNFVQYAPRIGKEWSKTSETFNEYYFRRAIARAIIFRRTEKMVSEQEWYRGGYRAGVVTYAIALVNECCRRKKKSVDFLRVWKFQVVYVSLLIALTTTAKFVNDVISDPDQNTPIRKWCQQDVCWKRILDKIEEIHLSEEFWCDLVGLDEQKGEEKQAKEVQKIDDGATAQIKVCAIPGKKWREYEVALRQRGMISEKEAGILEAAARIPLTIPSEKQSLILLDILKKVEEEGIR